MRLENYQTEIEENHHTKLAEIQKVEDYSQQYTILKKVYKYVVKTMKNNDELNLHEMSEKFAEDTFYFSD